MKFPDFNTDKYRELVSSLPASELRSIAAEKFIAQGFPTTRAENWRYTNLARAVEISNESFESDTRTQEPGELPDIATAIDAHWIVIRNGVVESSAEQIASGVSLLAGEANPAADEATALEWLSISLARQTIQLVVETAASPSKPIGLLFVDDGGEAAGSSHCLFQIDVGSDASVSIIEAHVSGRTGDHYHNGIGKIAVGSNANVKYLRLQDRSEMQVQTQRLVARIQDNASLTHFAADVGGSLIRNDLDVDLAAAGASVSMDGIFLSSTGQHIDNHTLVRHSVGPTQSREDYRGILQGRSRCVWNGKAFVAVGADGTDAAQANHNLLLSNDAEIDTKPELEIYADDVKAAHGATVGQLDNQSMFYMRSRGVDEQIARQMLIEAFVANVLARQPIDAARDYVELVVNRKLEQLTGDDHG